jgi:hypothetical protein
MIKSRFYYTLLALLAAPAIWAQPTLRVSSTASSLRVYDTLVVTATALDSIGRRQTTATITWLTRPQGAIAIRPHAALKGRVATIDAAAIGASYAIASWKRSDGRTIRDSLLVSVARPLAEGWISIYFALHRTPDGRIVGDSTRALDIGQSSGCVFVVTRDKRGNIITGLDPNLRPDVSSFGFISVTSRAGCPDTTVDPSRIVP